MTLPISITRYPDYSLLERLGRVLWFIGFRLMERKAMDDFSERRSGRPPAVEGDHRAERPTVRPPFDPAKFAVESEQKLQVSEPPSSTRPTPRALPRPPVPPVPPWGKIREGTRSSPELQAIAGSSDAREALGADAVAVLVMSREELEWFELGPEAIQILGHVDGISSIDSVCAEARISPQDGAAILLELAERGIVIFR
jgi:hypothetical protein